MQPGNKAYETYAELLEKLVKNTFKGLIPALKKYISPFYKL